MNDNIPWSVVRFKGTASWNSITHKGTTAVINEGMLGGPDKYAVRFTTAAAHGLVAGSAITLEGSTNYDGMHYIVKVPTTTTLVIYSKYVAETLTTSDTFKLTLKPEVPFEFGGFRLHLNVASATSENLTVTVDSGVSSHFDKNLFTLDMNTLQDVDWNIRDKPQKFDKDDEIDFAWANSNSKIYGLEVFWRRIGA